MYYGITDKWMAISVWRNEPVETKNCVKTGTSKWKICGSKSIASKYNNQWVTERDTKGEFPLWGIIIKVGEIGNQIRNFRCFNGKDSKLVADELTEISNQIISGARNVGVKFR